MKTFYHKVFDYVYTKRLELFQSLFYELYRSFEDRQEELLQLWFERYTLRKLLKYFPLEDLVAFYPEYAVKKRSLILSYIKTYWKYCRVPRLYPAKVKESMDFFQLQEVSLPALKKAYRSMVRKYHPDTYPNRREAHRRMLLINYHYQVLLSYLREAEHVEETKP